MNTIIDKKQLGLTALMFTGSAISGFAFFINIPIQTHDEVTLLTKIISMGLLFMAFIACSFALYKHAQLINREVAEQ